MTGKPAKAAEPPKKPKGDPWEQIVQGTQRAGRRRAEKPAEREKETAVPVDSEKTPEEIAGINDLLRLSKDQAAAAGMEQQWQEAKAAKDSLDALHQQSFQQFCDTLLKEQTPACPTGTAQSRPSR